MELQVPYRICSEISEADRVWKDQSEHWSNPADIVRAEKSGDPGSGSLCGSHPHAGEHPPEFERITICGVPEREKLADDI